MADRDRVPSFAELAPTYDTFPGFGPGDFAAFEKQKARSSDYNAERLLVKRKLAALGKPIAAALEARGLGVEARTSLSHPYSYNAYRVSSMWVYFGRDEEAKRAIKRRLGGELGKDVDPAYQGLFLLVEIDETRAACGLKVHPAAWWDGQNLKNKVLRGEKGATGESAAAELCRLLNALPAGYAMNLGDWRKRYESGKLHEADVRNCMQYFTPGSQWLNVLFTVPAKDVIAAGPRFAEDAARLLAAAVPVYRFVAWTPENDFVMGGGGAAAASGERK